MIIKKQEMRIVFNGELQRGYTSIYAALRIQKFHEEQQEATDMFLKARMPFRFFTN